MIIELFKEMQLKNYTPPKKMELVKGGYVSKEVAKMIAPKQETPYPSEIIKKLKKEVKDMNGFWDKIEDPDEFSPFLKVKSEVTYSLEIIFLLASRQWNF